jgi:hypothetical protein
MALFDRLWENGFLEIILAFSVYLLTFVDEVSIRGKHHVSGIKARALSTATVSLWGFPILVFLVLVASSCRQFTFSEQAPLLLMETTLFTLQGEQLTAHNGDKRCSLWGLNFTTGSDVLFTSFVPHES